MLALRPYQSLAIARVLDLLSRGVRRILIVLATGGGKTVIASALVRHLLEQGQRGVFLAHRREIIAQTYAKLVRNGLSPTEIGILMAGVGSTHAQGEPPETLTDLELWKVWARRRPRAPMQVGSIDTFRNRVKPPADFLFVDEAHRALAKSYRDVQLEYPGAVHLGLTATPFRADGKGLEDAYDELVVVTSFAELVGEGYLVEPRVYGTPRKVDLSGVRKSGSDYNAEDLAKAVDRGELVGDIVDHWLRLGNNAPTFAFASSVAHSQHIAERFVAAGVPAMHVDGETENGERERAIAGLRNGSIKVVSNVGVFTEGTDVPCVKTIILARPTLSEALYLQMAGRGARPHGGLPFVILDHAGCCTDPRLGGLPQEPREYSLEGRKKKDAAKKAPPAKECPGCYAIVAAAVRICPGCGHEFELAEEENGEEEAEGELELLGPQQRKRLEEWNLLVEEWREINEIRAVTGRRALSPAWCRREWKTRTGHWPPKGSRLPKPPHEPEELVTRVEWTL
jgi:DNA repair protein RadD